MTFYKIIRLIGIAATMVIAVPSVNAAEFSLSYFMGPKHPMNRAVFTPFAEKLSEASGGKLTVKQYPGGALNSAPPKQYSILIKGIADIAFGLSGYTGQLFPITNTVSVPGVCSDAVKFTESLWRVFSLVEKEYDAKILALWSNDPPVLITKDKKVTSLDDLKGMKIRVASKQQVPFIEALGASAVSQPVSVINQNLANGTIDGIAIGASGIRSFKLHEPANYIVTDFPGSGTAFFLLMNRKVFEDLSDEEKKWVGEASGKWLSENGGKVYKKAAVGGLKLAKSAGVEISQFSDQEILRMNAAMVQAINSYRKQTFPSGITGGEVVDLMKGE